MAQLFQSLIFPAIVATIAALLSYYGARESGQITEREATRKSRLNYIQLMLIEINKLNNTLDKLKDDLTRSSYFALDHVYSAQPAIDKVKRLMNDVLVLNDDEM